MRMLDGIRLIRRNKLFDFKVADMRVDYVDHLGGDINVVNAARGEY